MLNDARGFQNAFDVSHETLDKFKIFERLLNEWQGRMNLVGRASLDDFWHRHIIDSAQLVPLARHASRIETPLWVDLGSGAGFPGLVIAMMGGFNVHLIEATAKKCDFLRLIIKETEIDAKLHQIRIEDYQPSVSIDFISARAFAPLPRLLPLIARLFNSSTIALLHKGQNWQKELTAAQQYWTFAYAPHVSITDEQARILQLMHPMTKHIHAERA